MNSGFSTSFEHLMIICKTVQKILTEQLDASKGLEELEKKEAKACADVPLVLIKERFKLTRFEYLCLIFAATFAIDKGIGIPTIETMLDIYFSAFDVDKSVYRSLGRGKSLSYLLNIYESGQFQLNEDAFRFIIDDLIVDCDGLELIKKEAETDKPSLYKNERAEICNFLLKAVKPTLIKIIASAGSGKRTLAKQICSQLEKNALLITDTESLEKEERSNTICRIISLCKMTSSVPIVAGNDAKFAKEIVGKTSIAFLCTDKNDKDEIDYGDIIVHTVYLQAKENDVPRLMWEYASNGLNLDIPLISKRYRLCPAQIINVANSVRNQKMAGKCNAGIDDMEMLFSQIGHLNKSSVFTKLIVPAFGLNELIIDAKTEKKLHSILTTLRFRDRVYEEYGYDKLFPYGKGIGILFYGTPGTGKTMTAHALAKELGLNIMTADVSRIVDKYIGETEKHLNDIFETASQSNCILFFDECDSLFAKRTEVKDSHDRNANIQTSHLLQKMDEYGGAVILATNLIANLDDAFKRRLPFSIEFHRPDAVLRERLWRSFIPAKVPALELDFKHLADNYELSPAIIKWTAFSATVNAVSMGTPLTMEHLLVAIENEYEKIGAVFPKKSLINELVIN